MLVMEGISSSEVNKVVQRSWVTVTGDPDWWKKIALKTARDFHKEIFLVYLFYMHILKASLNNLGYLQLKFAIMYMIDMTLRRCAIILPWDVWHSCVCAMLLVTSELEVKEVHFTSNRKAISLSTFLSFAGIMYSASSSHIVSSFVLRLLSQYSVMLYQCTFYLETYQIPFLISSRWVHTIFCWMLTCHSACTHFSKNSTVSIIDTVFGRETTIMTPGMLK